MYRIVWNSTVGIPGYVCVRNGNFCIHLRASLTQVRLHFSRILCSKSLKDLINIKYWTTCALYQQLFTRSYQCIKDVYNSDKL